MSDWGTSVLIVSCFVPIVVVALLWLCSFRIRHATNGGSDDVPQVFSALGSLPSDSTECDSALRQLLGSHWHYVRYYGDAGGEGSSHKQATMMIGDEKHSFQQFLGLIKSGHAASFGMYWAMYTGADPMASDASCFDRFQQGLRDLVQLETAEECLPRLSLWRDRDLAAWWGPPGHVEQLHYDRGANVHFQLRGSKTWRLFPPWSVDLRPNSILGSSPDFNFSTSLLPELGGEPAEPRATFLADEIVLTVHPGEAIFVPAGWWHQVSGHSQMSQDYVFSVNLFEPRSQAPWQRHFLWHFFRLRAAMWIHSVRKVVCLTWHRCHMCIGTYCFGWGKRAGR